MEIGGPAGEYTTRRSKKCYYSKIIRSFDQIIRLFYQFQLIRLFDQTFPLFDQITRLFEFLFSNCEREQTNNL